jgi:hypothetical protein
MKVKIVSPVDHDGKRLEVGESINLPDRVARELLAAGAAEADGKQKGAQPVADSGDSSKGAGEPAEAPGSDEVPADQGGEQ